MDLISAIALLCGMPTYLSSTSVDVLACQKYYINCVTPTSPTFNSPNVLAACVLKKESLGGSK